MTSAFDLCGPLPTGTTILEASAGTGKTHTIAGLACRYLAEGHARIDELMLVTFGRAATAELRERVRRRLTDVTAALAVPTAATSTDDLVRHLAGEGPAETTVRVRRLRTALADFDAATIATTHGFCHQMLAGLGIAADLDHDVTFAETTTDLVRDTVSDLYLADYGRDDSTLCAGFELQLAEQLADNAVGDPSAMVVPEHPAVGSDAFVRVEFVRRAREEVARRKRAMRVMDYDDLLTHLRDALVDPETGADAQARIRSRYSVVLVDEFQDTDPVQWEILERTFHGSVTLVLIGDPKQAIYAFRGADVVTYLGARSRADHEATLGTNWRSDRPLVEGLAHLFGDAALGDPRIRVHTVAAHHDEASLVGAPVAAPVRLRRVPRTHFGLETTKNIQVDDARGLVADDVASDVVALLGSRAQVVERDGTARPVQARDVAVLVHRNDDGERVERALAALGVPVVFSAVSSVFATPAAREWWALLTALEQPQRLGLARSAALTEIVGWDAERLAAAGDAELDALGDLLHEWGDVLARRGPAALLEAVCAAGLQARVLGRVGGERDLTDLRHIGQALHEASAALGGGVASLVQWLRRRMVEAAQEYDEERSRRLQSDAKAVQVMTIWRAKGLEFPVVYTPYLWDKNISLRGALRLHQSDGRRVLDVGGEADPGHAARRDRCTAEDLEETLRLAYVALTRARCQVVAHWAPAYNTPNSALHRLLFGVRGPDGQVPARVATPDEATARDHLERIAATSRGLVSLETATGASGVPLPAAAAGGGDLAVRVFDRRLQRTWRRASYTGLTAGLHGPSGAATGSESGSEPEQVGKQDEPDEATSTAVVPGPRTGTVSPMADLPVGASFGTLVHSVLERADFAAHDLTGELSASAEAEGSERFAGVPPGVLADALVPALTTPLGPVAADLRLADVARRDRLDELDFELPLAGGDRATGDVDLTGVGRLLRDHLSSDDPLAGYAEDLAAHPFPGVRGFLTGSIDLVLRARGEGLPSAGRFLVVDYKTNWLGGPRGSGQPLLAEDYDLAAMAAEMRRSHYPLQALFYSVALHRYLRWRLPGYDAETHLGGSVYLFLRGLCGPQTPVIGGATTGVFAWTPPAALVEDLSALLAGRTR